MKSIVRIYRLAQFQIVSDTKCRYWCSPLGTVGKQCLRSTSKLNLFLGDNRLRSLDDICGYRCHIEALGLAECITRVVCPQSQVLLGRTIKRVINGDHIKLEVSTLISSPEYNVDHISIILFFRYTLWLLRHMKWHIVIWHIGFKYVLCDFFRENGVFKDSECLSS